MADRIIYSVVSDFWHWAHYWPGCVFKFEVASEKTLARITRTGIMIVYVFGFGIIIFQTQIEFILPVYKKFDDILPAVFFAFIILEQNYSNHSFLKFGQIKFMTYLGKI